MTKVLSIFLSIYIFVGTTILPKGDFGFTSQLSNLYDAFVQLNGVVSFDEFLAEELLDPYTENYTTTDLKSIFHPPGSLTLS